MRNFIPFFLLIVTISCNENTTLEKPENLIDVKTMEEILFDLSLMQSMQSNSYTSDKMKAYFSSEYIYIKHNIDSLQLSESEVYYSKTPKIYLEIHKKVLSRLNKVKDSMEEVSKKERAKQLEDFREISSTNFIDTFRDVLIFKWEVSRNL